MRPWSNKSHRRWAIGIAAMLLMVLSGAAPAAIIEIDISPAAGTALNLGANPYAGDHAIGLSAANSTSISGSGGSGNETGAGIFFDDVSKVLTLDFAYGNLFGFNFGPLHIHGPSAVNPAPPNSFAPQLFDLAGIHTPLGQSGSVSGSVILSAAQEVMLFDNALYLNIPTTFVGGGEIRGQLIPVESVLIPLPAALWLVGVPLLGLARIRRP